MHTDPPTQDLEADMEGRVPTEAEFIAMDQEQITEAVERSR